MSSVIQAMAEDSTRAKPIPGADRASTKTWIAVEIQLGGQVSILRMLHLQMQVSWSEAMPTECVEHDAGRTILRDLIGRRNNPRVLSGYDGSDGRSVGQPPACDQLQDSRISSCLLPLAARPLGQGG